MHPLERRAARVLLVNALGEVLLMHGFDPGAAERGGWWLTPGGGIDPGEEPLAAAARELFEETGLALPPHAFTGPVHHRTAEFVMEGQRYRQEEQFYVARVDRWAVDTAGFTPLEQRSVDGYRWWPIAELRDTDETYYPAELPELVQDALAPRKEA